MSDDTAPKTNEPPRKLEPWECPRCGGLLVVNVEEINGFKRIIAKCTKKKCTYGRKISSRQALLVMGQRTLF